MNKSFFEDMEMQEIIEKLNEAGFNHIVETFLTNEKLVYTKKGRLNKSGACRQLGWRSKQLEESLSKCREVLRKDVLTPEEIEAEDLEREKAKLAQELS